MRQILSIGALVAAICLAPAGASARVAPLTPEARLMFERQQALENAVRERFGDPAFNGVREAYGSIIVAEETSRGLSRPRVLVKDETGWFELRGSGRRKLSDRVAHELNRLLVPEALWNEQAHVEGRHCPGRARLFIIRHAQKDKFGRQACGPSGRAGRAAEVAASLRVPAGGDFALPAPTRRPPPSGLPPAEYAVGEHIFDRLSEMTASWQRRSLAGFVDPFAADAIVELPGRRMRGRGELVEWARSVRDWSAPPRGGRTRLHRAEMPRLRDGTMIVRWEVRWGEEEGRPMRRTHSATWRENRGLWEIAHLRMSEDKPVTDERQIW